MDGFQFEYRCAELLRNRGFHKVSVTKSVGDQGIDVIAYKNGEKYGIQCKYYSHTVGNKAVQEAYSGAGFYDCDHAMVMTNSTFSRAAKELAQKLDVELMDNCPSNDISGALYKLMRFFNVSVILLLFFILCSFLAFQYPSLTFLHRCYMGIVFAAALLGLLGWHRFTASLISFVLYLFLFVCIITPEIFYRTLNPWWLSGIIPVLLNLIHLVFLRRDMDDAEEERPVLRKEKRKIARLGRLYADSLSVTLEMPVTYRYGTRTEEGCLFEFDSPCTDESRIRRAVLNFGRTFHHFYEFQFTESGFSILQYDKKRQEDDPPV